MGQVEQLRKLLPLRWMAPVQRTSQEQPLVTERFLITSTTHLRPRRLVRGVQLCIRYRVRSDGIPPCSTQHSWVFTISPFRRQLRSIKNDDAYVVGMTSGRFVCDTKRHRAYIGRWNDLLVAEIDPVGEHAAVRFLLGGSGDEYPAEVSQSIQTETFT